MHLGLAAWLGVYVVDVCNGELQSFSTASIAFMHATLEDVHVCMYMVAGKPDMPAEEVFLVYCCVSA